MVRWIAVSALLSRFKLAEYAKLGLVHAQHDPDEVVKGAAISGLGEVLPSVIDKSLSKDIASFLVKMYENGDNEEYIDYREDAYEGILAAMNISPLERPPANRPLDADLDVDTNMLIAFKRRYLGLED